MEQLDPALYSSLRARIPACVGIDTRNPDIDIVGYDHFEAGMRLANHLIRKGHQKIAFLGGTIFGPRGAVSRRYLGFVAAMHVAGLPIRSEWVLDCKWDEILCIDLIKALMAQPDPPTAICAASDLMAMAALSALYSIGVRVPEQHPALPIFQPAPDDVCRTDGGNRPGSGRAFGRAAARLHAAAAQTLSADRQGRARIRLSRAHSPVFPRAACGPLRRPLPPQRPEPTKVFRAFVLSRAGTFLPSGLPRTPKQALMEQPAQAAFRFRHSARDIHIPWG